MTPESRKLIAKVNRYIESTRPPVVPASRTRVVLEGVGCAAFGVVMVWILTGAWLVPV